MQDSSHNPPIQRSWSRRDFLQTGAIAAAATATGLPLAKSIASTSTDKPLAFFIISDTHYLAQRDSPSEMIPGSRALNQRLIDTLNNLPGKELPEEVGGGTIAEPSGVIHLGDIVDTGDKFGGVNAEMTETEWRAYVEDYGITGKEGRLRHPIYELHGNHDTPRQHNVVIREIIERNPKRPGVNHISENGLHYAWDWAGIRFISLGITVGNNDDDLPIGRYESFQSLPFLIADLENHVGNSGRPVILLHHIDLHRHIGECDTTKTGLSREMCCEGMKQIAWCSGSCNGRSSGITLDDWGPCDVRAFYRAIKDYNIVSTFHGHLHSRRNDTWDGTTINAQSGIPVIGANNSGAGGGNRSLLYCSIENDHLVVREYHSDGNAGWDPDQAKLQWLPQVRRIPLQKA